MDLQNVQDAAGMNSLQSIPHALLSHAVRNMIMLSFVLSAACIHVKGIKNQAKLIPLYHIKMYCGTLQRQNTTLRNTWVILRKSGNICLI
jgi:hypothetical protein